jgi:MFS transporter, PAT family, beta-lactamase induction signal transducer AmpG
MSVAESKTEGGWHARLPKSVHPYIEAAPLAAFCLGVSSGFPFALIGATLTTRLAQDGITKSAVTAFALTFLAYNFKFLWAPVVDNFKLPVIGRFGQRRSWLWVISVLVILAVVFLGVADPNQSLLTVAVAAITLGVAGATLDIIIDAYRIELLEPHQLGTGSGMSQYGWRIGAAATGALALIIASSFGWSIAYITCSLFALPAILVGVFMGEPRRHLEPVATKGVLNAFVEYFSPLTEFIKRQGAWVVLFFVLIHKIGDTLANLTLRLLFNDLGFSNEEIAFYDVGFGFIAFLAGIFIGGIMYTRMGLKHSVLVSLVLMAVSNFSFAALALVGHTNWGMAGAVGFENFASGIGGVTVVAYLSALCNLRFTATQYALLSALASIAGRFFTGTTAGGLIQSMGYVNYYLLTTLVAFPGVVLFWYMIRSGLADVSLGSAIEKGGAKD